MRIRVYQVDAFTERVFGGNPAAVCPLDEWLPEKTLQAIARENNLSETAFFAPERDGFRLRWFTPLTEVNLCGHATLASAFVLFEKLGARGDSVRFFTHSGPLAVTRAGGLFALDLPANPPEAITPPPELAGALGRHPVAVYSTSEHYVAVFEDPDAVAGLEPDFPAVRRLERFGVIATAPGDDVDFVSRYFAPRKGIDEDPVTGSAHCVLAPYWGVRLGRPEVRATQLSFRGGSLTCALRGDRVVLKGAAVLYLEGEAMI